MFYNDAHITLSESKIHDLLNCISYELDYGEFIPDYILTREDMELCFLANIRARFGNNLIPAGVCPNDPATRRKLLSFYYPRMLDGVLSALARAGVTQIEANGEITQAEDSTTKEQRNSTAPDRDSFAVTLAEFRELAGMPWGYPGAPLYEGHRAGDGASYLIPPANDDVYAAAC